mgnify:CR=1 FL=1
MMDVFSQHMDLIKKSKFDFYHPKKFENQFEKKKKQKKILLTVDDAFESFYKEAWPYLKKNEIPFILFTSTEPVGKNGYMTWDEIKEIDQSEIGHIGHHSHTHEYLIDWTNDKIKTDLLENIRRRLIIYINQEYTIKNEGIEIKELKIKYKLGVFKGIKK